MDFIIIDSDQWHNQFVNSNKLEAPETIRLSDAIQKKMKSKYNTNIEIYKDVSKDDLTDEINYATKFANKTILNIHSNAGPIEASGVEGIYYSSDMKMKNFATIICNKISKVTGLQVRRVFSDDGLAMMSRIPNPSILIETFFHTNPNDVKIYLEKFNSIAEAYCDGIAEYFGIKIFENKKVEDIPQWKIDGEKWMFDNGIISSRHNPEEPVDFGELGTILRNFALHSITKK